MDTASTATATATATGTDRDAEAFETIDGALKDGGPGEALGRLVVLMEAREEARGLLDALLLKARHDLGLPLIPSGGLADLPEPVRSQYEERYVEAIRRVGGRLLEAGEIAAAWPYYRAIGETGPVVQAIDAFDPAATADERLGQVVDVAFNQGAHPARGFALILEHYGACSAITAFEHLPPDAATRLACADRLVRHLHAQLAASLRGEIARRGQPAPPEGTGLPGLMAGRDWLFAEDAYHLDVSHLGAVVRLAPILEDPGTLALAVELTDYGRKLSDRHKYEGEPPFERTYEDHGLYLGALIHRDVDAALAAFRGKLPLPPPAPEGSFEDSLPAQVFVRLLARLGLLEEAIEVAGAHLRGRPESALICPGLAELCRRAGRPDRLAQLSRDHGDLVNYAAAILQRSAGAGAVASKAAEETAK